MKIYYAAAVRGAHLTDNSFLHKSIIEHLLNHHIVLTEHLADGSIKDLGETGMPDKEIHDRDMHWVRDADIIIAEVSNPSLGVGYELGRAVELGKKILCLFRPDDKPLSAMISGSDKMIVREYRTKEEALDVIDNFLKKIEISEGKAHSIKQINKEVMHDLLTGKHEKK
jgi:2'-deoxynucleoside 5'-phosphate N-hydrolase